MLFSTLGYLLILFSPGVCLGHNNIGMCLFIRRQINWSYPLWNIQTQPLSQHLVITIKTNFSTLSQLKGCMHIRLMSKFRLYFDFSLWIARKNLKTSFCPTTKQKTLSHFKFWKQQFYPHLKKRENVDFRSTQKLKDVDFTWKTITSWSHLKDAFFT